MNDDDIPEDESPEEAREWFQREVKTKGLRAAYATLLGVCEDPKAPAPAKATAGVALMRAAGMFAAAEEADEKQPHEMTAAEIDAELRRLRRKRGGALD